MAEEWEESVGKKRRSPQMQHLEEVLRSSKFASEGFLGHDKRYLEDIIDTDVHVAYEYGASVSRIARRMREITELARRGLETMVQISDKLEACTNDVRGKVPCPWPHPGLFNKTVTTVRRKDTGETLQWSDLNIHMIEAHGFFEGRGSRFRLEPEHVIDFLFIESDDEEDEDDEDVQ